MTEEGPYFPKEDEISLTGFDPATVLFGETDVDVVVGFGQIVHNTVDVRLGVLRTTDVAVTLCIDIERI